MVLMSTKSQDLREAIRSKAAITFRGWTVRRTVANAASRSLGALGRDCLERASLAYFRVAVVRTIKQGEAAASLAQMAARGAKGDAAVAALVRSDPD